MIPLHEDFDLTIEQQNRVRHWLREIGPLVAGTTAEDFEILPRARYVGFMFTHEDLEAFTVGLQCTKPGMEDTRTTVRMSHGQLLGVPGAPTYEPHAPVTASDAMTMNRWRRRGFTNGGAGIPGIDLDQQMLTDYLEEILEYHAAYGTDLEGPAWYELSVQWGVVVSGRLPRIEHYAGKGQLSEPQATNFAAFREAVRANKHLLKDLSLAFPGSLED